MIPILVIVSGAVSSLLDSGFLSWIFQSKNPWVTRVAGWAVHLVVAVTFVEAVVQNQKEKAMIALLLPVLWNMANVPSTLALFLVSQQGKLVGLGWALLYFVCALGAAFAAVMLQHANGM